MYPCLMALVKRKQQQQAAAGAKCECCRFKRVPAASDGSAQCKGVRGGQRCGVVNADLAVSTVIISVWVVNANVALS